MLFTSQWLPSRIPSTILLLPLFWIALLVSPNLNEWRSLWVLVIVHGLLYAAANLYLHANPLNTDRSPGSRPSTTRLFGAIVLHSAGIVLSIWTVNYAFAVLITGYGVIAYAFAVGSSFTNKLNFSSWSIIRLVQGLGAMVVYYIGLNNFPVGHALQLKVVLPGIMGSLILAAFFPLSNPRPVEPAAQTRMHFTKEFYLALTFLITAAVTGVFFFRLFVSSQYVVGVLLVFTLGLWRLIDLHHESLGTVSSTKSVWLRWLGTLSLNVYAFYVFTDYTNILQLLR